MSHAQRHPANHACIGGVKPHDPASFVARQKCAVRVPASGQAIATSARDREHEFSPRVEPVESELGVQLLDERLHDTHSEARCGAQLKSSGQANALVAHGELDDVVD